MNVSLLFKEQQQTHIHGPARVCSAAEADRAQDSLARRWTNLKPNRPFTHRWPWVTSWSSGEVTFTMRLSCTCRGLPDRAWQRAQLSCDWTSSPDVEDWVPVRLAPDPLDGNVLATPGRRGAGSVSRLTRAHAWWPIPVGEAKFTRGEQIDVLPIPGAPR
jgi:MoeA-like protein